MKMKIKYLEVFFLITSALEHIMTHHHQCDGWITLASKEGGHFRQKHYRLNEITNSIENWFGKDSYFSQNTFYTTYRRIDSIRELRSLYIDIDCYNKGYPPDWTLRKLELEVFNQTVPEPNNVIFSGRGLVLIWRIEPSPYMALPLWQAIQHYLFEQFEYVGADAQSLDAARIFRMAGSTNSKNGHLVKVLDRHDYIWSLREIQHDYLPQLKSHNRTLNKTEFSKKYNDKINNLFNSHTLHYSRLLDIRKVLELRNYDVKGYRESFCFLFRYWSCCFLGDTAEALRQTLELNDQFIEPLSEHEVKTATKNAEAAYDKRYDEIANETANLKGFKKAGYNFTNTRLIEWLNITPDEQRFLRTIISKAEKYSRNNESRAKIRRDQGTPTREEYLQQQYLKTESKSLLLQQQIERDPKATNGDLASHIGCSESYIRRLRKRI